MGFIELFKTEIIIDKNPPQRSATLIPARVKVDKEASQDRIRNWQQNSQAMYDAGSSENKSCSSSFHVFYDIIYMQRASRTTAYLVVVSELSKEDPLGNQAVSKPQAMV